MVPVGDHLARRRTVAPVENVITPATDAVSASPADRAPQSGPESAKPRPTEADARRAFSTSMLVSATRCLLTYIVLPFVAPLLGIAGDVGPGLGIAIGLVAVVSNCLTIRRFHAAQHRWRWGYTAIAVCVIIGLTVLMVQDLIDLIG
jgi:hypothetical protein